MCFDFHYKFSETFLIVRRIKRGVDMNMHKSSREVPVIFVRFLFKLELSRQIFENFLIPNDVKIRPVEVALFLAGGRMDRRDETKGRSSHFCHRA